MAFKIANFINTYWFPVLIPIGLVGNILSFVVMIKPKNTKMSTCIYMAAISINDNLMMASSLNNFLVIAMEIHKWHLWECKLAAFCALFALQNSSFQVLAIKWPHKAATYSTPKRARMVAVGLSVCAFIYNSPHFDLTHLLDGQCLAYGPGCVLSKIYSWFSFVLNAIIPFTLLIYMNFVIVKAVRNSREMFGAKGTTTGTVINQGMDTRQKSMKSVENQLTIMLLLVTTLFLILLCP